MNTDSPINVERRYASVNGITLPVVLTAAAWNDTVTWTGEDTDLTGVPQDEVGRLTDVLWMASRAVKAAETAGERGVIGVPFTVYRVPRGIPYQDDDETGAYEALCETGMFVIVAGTPRTVTISLEGE